MLLGLDVSSAQKHLDLRDAKAAGLSYVFVKVSEGCDYRNPAWPAHRDQARANDMPLIAYHYVKEDDPDGQAANCKRWLGDISIPIMLDHEAGGGDWCNFERVLKAFRAAGLNVVLIYEPRWYHTEIGSPDMSGCGLHLVCSRYPSSRCGTPQDLARGITPNLWSGYGGLTPVILQFSDRGQVAGIDVDLDAFQGSRVELEALLGGAGGRPGSEDAVALIDFPATPLPQDVNGARWQDTDPATWPKCPEQKTALVHSGPNTWRGVGSLTSVTCGWAIGRSQSDALSDPVVTFQDGPDKDGKLKPSGWIDYVRVFWFADGPGHGDWRVVDLYNSVPIVGNRSLPSVELPEFSTFLVVRYAAPGGLYIGLEWEH